MVDYEMFFKFQFVLQNANSLTSVFGVGTSSLHIKRAFCVQPKIVSADKMYIKSKIMKELLLTVQQLSFYFVI